ncbi:MAG: HAD family phosphatase [Muribaculaceae bacterium]|nr:HAD family phosphatase [Muribaculaceae bacterium]
MPIKNLMFDLGGVIMDICRLDCVAAFDALGMKDANSFFGEYSQSGPFLRLEAGEIDPPTFRDEMRRLITATVTDAELDAALNRFLTGIPARRLRVLEQLRRRYGIYLLSNTNPIMWDSRISEQFCIDGHNREYYFDGTLTSFEAGVNKPAREIFEAALRKFQIEAPETLFLDDSQKNLDAAASMGFNTLLVKPGCEFDHLLKDMGFDV